MLQITYMETGAIAQVAYRFKKKFISARIVSDAIRNPECGKYEDFWGTAGDTLHYLLTLILDNSQKISLFSPDN